MEKIYSDIELVEENSDAGPIYEGRCPKCTGAFRLAPHQWWRPTCDCGIRWNLIIHAEADAPTEITTSRSAQ